MDDDGAMFRLKEKAPLITPQQVAALEEKLASAKDIESLVKWFEEN